MKNILLSFFAFTSLFSSILVITSKNPVVAVIFLISVFLSSAELLLELGVGFVGISYIIIYVGAITVLFLFVIMSINIKLTDILESGSQYTKNIPLALSVGLLFTYELIKIIPFNIKNISILDIFVDLLKILNDTVLGTPKNSLTNVFSAYYFGANGGGSLDTNIFNFLHIESLGLFLYTDTFLILIVCALILLLSLAAPIFLSRKV